MIGILRKDLRLLWKYAAAAIALYCTSVVPATWRFDQPTPAIPLVPRLL